jgi:hypothetical protein
MGFTGGLSTGLQVFVPLSPKHLLMLYDAGVYRVGTWKNPLVTKKLANSDVTKLNSLQVHTADENLYFNDWSDEKFVEYIVRRSVGQRIVDPTRVDEYVDPDNELHSMLHRYDLMPNLMLRLSFVTVQDKAKRIPMRIRVLPTHNVRRNNGEIVPEPPSGPLVPNGTLFVPRNRLPQSQSGRKKQR